jgi:hypothetical protein
LGAGEALTWVQKREAMADERGRNTCAEGNGTECTQRDGADERDAESKKQKKKKKRLGFALYISIYA